jgi:predicted nucleic acid-binding protein
MTRVLVDTAIWVQHFRQRNAPLIDLLELDLAMIHPMVLGEIACGTPPAGVQTLADLARLQSTQQASVREVSAFLERERLYGEGCALMRFATPAVAPRLRTSSR